jgi:regulator of chromosome condensation
MFFIDWQNYRGDSYPGGPLFRFVVIYAQLEAHNMPPKRVATKSDAPSTARPTRKRAAEGSDPIPAKRPRRASSNREAAEKPSTTTKVARGKATKTALAPKRAGVATTKKGPAKSVPASRSRATAKIAKATVAKTVEKTEATPKPKTPRVLKPKPPPFNALPTIHSPRLYPIHAFVFGNGDAGQFGLGPDVVDEIGRPKHHSWIKEAIDEGKFGEKGSGFEVLVAGGMHSIAISPNGKVRHKMRELLGYNLTLSRIL